MEIGRTNEACKDCSDTLGEKVNEMLDNRDRGSTSHFQANSEQRNASVTKTLLRWRRYLILLLTPLLLAPLPIAVPGSVRLSALNVGCITP